MRLRSLAVLAVLALAGCGGDDGQADPDTAGARATASRALRALAGGDGTTYCRLLTPAARAEQARRGAASPLRRPGDDPCGASSSDVRGSYRDPRVGRVDSDGQTARVAATVACSDAPCREPVRMRLARGDGRWRVAAVAPGRLSA